MPITKRIGETITYNGKAYKVREAVSPTSCNGCAFGRSGHPARCMDIDRDEFANAFGECAAMVRSDKQYVVFSLVK